MVNRSGNIGTAAETAVVKALRNNGFPAAERRRLRGRDDWGDLTGTPGLIWSVKGGNAARTASDNQVASWLDEAEAMRARALADHAILVVARRGIGLGNAHRWWAVVWCSTLLGLHQAADDPWDVPMPWVDMPVRLYLEDACKLLVAAGYGTPAAIERHIIGGRRYDTVDVPVNGSLL